MKLKLSIPIGLCFTSIVASPSCDNNSDKSSPNEKPNIIFIMVDDMGWTDLECYGSDLHETPNIDRLAGEGMRFTNAYSAAAICTPTRAALMTGKHPARLNMTIWHEYSGEPRPAAHERLAGPFTESNLPLDEYTIAEALRDEGYYTAHVGKWHLGNAVHYPEAHGFNINIGGTMWGMPFTYWYPFSGWRAIDNEFRYVPGLENPAREDEGSYLTDRLTDEAIKIIEARKDEPLFMHLSYYSPHVPVEGKPGFTRYFEEKISDGMIHRNAEYAAMIASIDENVGRIMDFLKKESIEDNTIVFFYSDNGGLDSPRVNVNNNYPLRSGKGSLYEGGIRVPLIVKWPSRISPHSLTSLPVTTMDFYPTILEMTNTAGDESHNKNIDGVSLAPVLTGQAKSLEKETLFWHYPHYYPNATTPVSAMRKGDWKLLHYFEDDSIELYNLADDQGETDDLSGQLPELRNRLYNMLQIWRQEINAQFPSLNPDFSPEM